MTSPAKPVINPAIMSELIFSALLIIKLINTTHIGMAEQINAASPLEICCSACTTLVFPITKNNKLINTMLFHSPKVGKGVFFSM